MDTLKIVNDSGFAFQLAVEEQIRRTQGEHPWSVVTREHPWRNPETGNEGYIDIVLARDVGRMAVECKRRGGKWVFLVPEQPPPADRATFRWVDVRTGKLPLFGWTDYRVSPPSYESEFCSIHGQDKEKPMLERTCDILLESLECLAGEELRILQREAEGWTPGAGMQQFFSAMIVTSAELEVFFFDPAKVNLGDGKLPEGESKHESVPFVRFRKSLTTEIDQRAQPISLDHSKRDKERSVFIVNSAHISAFLKAWRVRGTVDGKPDPWEILRRGE